MRWLVEITGLEGNHRLLREVLGELSITILEQQAERFLVSETFETLGTPGDVRALVVRVRTILEEAGNTDPQLQLKFKIGSVFEEGKDGTRKKHAFAALSGGTIRMTGRVMSATLKMEPSVPPSEDERKRLEEEQKEREYQHLSRKAISRIVSAFRDDRAVQVQRILHGELTPQTMSHIAELIQDDIGNVIRNLISDNQWTRFKRSISHPDVFGVQSRHIVSNDEPPPNPMSFGEAREFIRTLANRWMDIKAGLTSVPESN